MFDAKDIIGDAVKRAVKLFSARTRGDVVAWVEIETTAGFTRESPHWRQFDKRVRRDYRRASGVVLWPVNGTGLKLLTTDEQLNMRSIARQRRALRQMTRDIVELQSLPDKELTDHQRNTKHRKIDQARTARRAVLYSDRLGHQLAKPTEIGIPRPPRSR